MQCSCEECSWENPQQMENRTQSRAEIRHQQKTERKVQTALRKAERMAAQVDRLAAKIEKEAARAQKAHTKSETPKIERKRAKSERKNSMTNSESYIPEIGSVSGQTHSQAKEFRMIARNANTPAIKSDIEAKILGKHYQKIIIDGNNMLYVTSRLRSFSTHRKRKQADNMISVAALAFSPLVGITTEVVFDSTSLPKGSSHLAPSPVLIDQQSRESFHLGIGKILENYPVVGVPIVFGDGTSVMVSSAGPKFASTDDMLISWAKDNVQVSSGLRNEEVVVVSSDNALIGELHSLGVSCIKPGHWIKLFASLVGGERDETEKKMLFSWFDDYVASFEKSNI
jgi:translation initiation factor 1 (eIF-1/SUI1)